MDRSKLSFIIGIALLILQSTHGAELNSEATLNCNGKEFKCVNVTHYQPCSLSERAGQESQYMINGEILPCAADVRCNNEESVGCALARSVPVSVEATPVKTESVDEVPVKTDVVAEVVPDTPLVKSINVEIPDAVPVEVVAEVVAVSSTEKAAEKVAEQAVVAASDAPAVDSAKSAVVPAKKRKLAKFSPKRLIKGFRAASWRPRVSLESQKDVVDSLRKRIFERRNKYESFVNTVLGKATPVKQSVVPVKQPAPGAPLHDDYDEADDGPDDGDDNEVFRVGRQVETTTDFPDTTTDIGSNNTEPPTIIQLTVNNGTNIVNNGSSIVINATPDQFENEEEEDDEQDDIGHRKPGKPINNNENQVIVETNPVNNIIVEAPVITTIIGGHPYPGASGGCNNCQPCNCPTCCPSTNNCNCNGCQSNCNNNCNNCPCECEVEKPCTQCAVVVNKPCSNPCTPPCHNACPSPCDNCGHPDEIITTIEIIETCPTYDEPVLNDDDDDDDVSIGGETNQTQAIHQLISTYNISTTELASQWNDYQILMNSRGILCGGLHGIRHDDEESTISVESNDTSVRRRKPAVVANIVNNHNNHAIQQCTITSGWYCRKHGVYPHPSSCQKYIQCNFCGGNAVFNCPYDESFDGKRCSTDWSTCGVLKGCQYDRESIEDPWNESSYFFCVRKKLHKHFFIFRRHCPDGQTFDPIQKLCVCPQVVVVVVEQKPPCKKCGSHHG